MSNEITLHHDTAPRRRTPSVGGATETKRSRHRSFVLALASLLPALSLLGTVPARAAGTTIETMPLWRLQVRVTTGADGTDGHPSFRFNASTTGVRALNPRSKGAFDVDHVDTYDLRLFDSAKQITMFRIGIASDPWCVKKVELLLNGRLAFSRSLVRPGVTTCTRIDAGHPLDFTAADLRSDPRWAGFVPPALPTGVTAGDLRAVVESVTGSEILNDSRYAWDLTVPLTVARTTSHTFRVSYGVERFAPPEAPLPVKISYEVRLFVGADGRLHATKFNAATVPPPFGDLVVAHLNKALSRMTAKPQQNPLTFGLDAFTNLSWRYIPVIG